MQTVPPNDFSVQVHTTQQQLGELVGHSNLWRPEMVRNNRPDRKLDATYPKLEIPSQSDPKNIDIQVVLPLQILLYMYTPSIKNASTK